MNEKAIEVDSITVPGPITLGGLVRKIQIVPDEMDHLKDRRMELDRWLWACKEHKKVIRELDDAGIAPGSADEKRRLEACFGDGPESRETAAAWADEAYERAAPVYIRRWMLSPHQPFAPGRNHIVAEALKTMIQGCDEIMDPPLALDYGCGAGDYSLFLAAMGFQVDATDLMPYVRFVQWRSEIRGAKRFPNGNISVFSLDGLDAVRYRWHETERYHAIVCTAVLEHVPEPLAALQKLVGGLQPNGYLLLAQYPFKATNLAQADHMNWVDEYRDECLALLDRTCAEVYTNGVVHLLKKNS